MAWLGEHPSEQFVSSALVEVEVPRALRRDQLSALSAVAAAADAGLPVVAPGAS